MNILNESALQAPSRAVLIWLKSSLMLVLCMVAIGGLTRLTESGLSIVEWKLVTGIFPPLTQEGWQAEFQDYQSTPEFIKKNSYMELSDFKRIFWLEYLHRLLGRLIGLVFLIPLLFFSFRSVVSQSLTSRHSEGATRLKNPSNLTRQAERWILRSAQDNGVQQLQNDYVIPVRWLKRFWGIFALICLQGAVGWYMVKSGLVHNPWVSPYRLAFHLSLATVILGCIYICIKGVQGKIYKPYAGKLVLTLIAVQIIWGAFVAGLDAGMIYNSFPLMSGDLMPDELFSSAPAWASVFEHHATVQFVHRWFAFIVFAAIAWQAVRQRNTASYMVLGIAILQITLGIATLLSVVNITLASIHQLVAMGLVLAQLNVIIKSPSGVNSGITIS